MMEILDQYTTQPPSIQDTLDIFKGEWSSKLPDLLSSTEAGTVLLFADDCIFWAAEMLGGFTGKTVLDYQRQINQLQQQLQEVETRASQQVRKAEVKAKTQVEQLQQQLQDSQNRITAMETSKFWKLRQSWFRFKKTVGLPSNE